MRATVDNIELSLVLPCYRDAPVLSRRLPPLVQCLEGEGMEWEIILSDDGSGDRGKTKGLCQLHPRIRYVTGKVNRGKGAAVARGMQMARGTYRLFTDADVPFGADSVLAVWRCLKVGGAQVVLGNRSAQRQSGMRGWVSYLYYHRIAPWLTDAGWDTQCGLKGFHAAVVPALFGELGIFGYAFDVEVLRRVRAHRFRVDHVPVVAFPATRSHVSIPLDGLRFVRDVGRLLWRDAVRSP